MSLAGRLTIDLGAIVQNWKALDALTGSGCETAAVIKANAYGCGADVVGRALAGAGAKTFFVALMDEGFALRAALGPGPRIYVFAGTDDRAEMLEAAAQDVRPVLNSAEQAHFAAAMAQETGGLRAAVQLDTGMNRLGIEVADYARLMADPQMSGGALSLDLVFSHMGCADDPANPLNARQRATFERATSGGAIARRSLSATAGALLGPDYHYDMTRIGIGLYAGAPFERGQPAVKIEVPVIQVRDLAPGETVGYGAMWTAKHPSRIATISAGYADGLIRALSNGAEAFLQAKAVPLAGRVSMDLITLDVTDCACAPGDLVELIGESQSLDTVAAAAGTIGHEILTALGGRYHRTYLPPPQGAV